MALSQETRFQLNNLRAHFANKAEEERTRVRNWYDPEAARGIIAIQEGAFMSCINTIDNILSIDDINRQREARQANRKPRVKKVIKLPAQVSDRFADLEH